MGIVGGRTGKGEVSWEGYMARGTALGRVGSGDQRARDVVVVTCSGVVCEVCKSMGKLESSHGDYASAELSPSGNLHLHVVGTSQFKSQKN